MLFSRIIVALIFIPLLLSAVIIRGPFLLVVVVASVAIAGTEFCGMFHHRGIRVSLAGTVLVGLAYVWPTHTGENLWPWVLGATLLAALLSGLGPGSLAERARSLVLALLGGSYIGFFVRYALLIGDLPDGAALGALVLAGAWGADTGGYLVGRRFGRHLLAPAISPRKTWEGVGGALLLSIAAVALMKPFLPIAPLYIVPLGVVIGLAAVVGDLLESAVKRFTGVKDASNLLAGHGGYLDRMDSMLLVLPVVYAFAVSFME